MRCQNTVTSIGGWLGFFAATTSALETGFDSETFPHPALVPKPTFRDLCPVPCADVGPTGFSWTVVPSIAALKQCNETLLFEGNLNRPITSTARENTIRACSVPESSSNTALASEQKFGPPCLASAELRPTKVDVEVGWWPETVDGSKSSDIVDATLQLQKNIIEDPNCESTALFAKSGDAIEGVLFLLAFVGPIVGSLGRVGAALGRLIMAIEGAGAAGLGVYAIIEDPSSAPLAILLTIMGELGGPAGRSGRFAGLNAKKNEMSTKQKENMGKSYAANTPKVQSIMGKACGTK
ncbi:hypothetical protein BN1723_013455, partial [Verticillium longisporum]